MAESGVILPVDSTGKALRTETVTTTFTTGSDGFAHQQVITLGDPTTAANLAGVTSAGALQVVAPDAAITGTLASLNDFIATPTNGRGEVAFQLTGTWVGTVTFQGTVSPSGTSAASALWVTIDGTAPASSSAPTVSTTSNGVYVVRVAGYTAVRLFTTAWTSGTATVWANASAASTTVALGDPLPAGTNSIGTVHNAIDLNRTPVVLSATAVTSATTAALFTLNIWQAGAVTSGTSFTVPAGKTFRVQGIQFGARFATPATTVTFASSRFDLRAISGGTLSATSALVYGDTKMAAANTPTPNSDLAIPEGLEFPAGYVIGVSHVDSATTLLLDLLIVGYLY